MLTRILDQWERLIELDAERRSWQSRWNRAQAGLEQALQELPQGEGERLHQLLQQTFCADASVSSADRTVEAAPDNDADASLPASPLANPVTTPSIESREDDLLADVLGQQQAVAVNAQAATQGIESELEAVMESQAVNVSLPESEGNLDTECKTTKALTSSAARLESDNDPALPSPPSADGPMGHEDEFAVPVRAEGETADIDVSQEATLPDAAAERQEIEPQSVLPSVTGSRGDVADEAVQAACDQVEEEQVALTQPPTPEAENGAQSEGDASEGDASVASATLTAEETQGDDHPVVDGSADESQVIDNDWIEKNLFAEVARQAGSDAAPSPVEPVESILPPDETLANACGEEGDPDAALFAELEALKQWAISVIGTEGLPENELFKRLRDDSKSDQCQDLVRILKEDPQFGKQHNRVVVVS